MTIFSTLIRSFLTKIDDILQGYVYAGYQSLVDYLAAPLGAAIVLFFVFYGLAISQGWIKGSVAGMTYSLFKIGVIYFIGMNWGNFSEYVYDLFYKVSGEIGEAILNNSSISLNTTANDTSINGALQYVFNEIIDLAVKLFMAGGPFNIGSWFFGGLIIIAGTIFVAFALLEVVIAKCLLSILFVVAPLFIAFTLFEVTQSFFDRWLGACMGYASLMIFISAGLGIVLSLDEWILSFYTQTEAGKMNGYDLCAFVLITWLCIGLIKRISLLALSIGGTVSTISAEESFASSIGATLGAASFGKNAYDFIKGKFSENNSNSNINDRSRFLKDTASENVSSSDRDQQTNDHNVAADRDRYVRDTDADAGNRQHYQDHSKDENNRKNKNQSERKTTIRTNSNLSTNKKKDNIESDYD